jgi:hypothetical protein
MDQEEIHWYECDNELKDCVVCQNILLDEIYPSNKKMLLEKICLILFSFLGPIGHELEEKFNYEAKKV